MPLNSNDSLLDIKREIWTHRKIQKNPISLQVAADRAGVRLPITQIAEAEKLLKSLDKRKPAKKAAVPPEVVLRYVKAHEQDFATKYPQAYKDGHYPGMEPEFPDTSTGNGLNKFMVNFLLWSGHRATRINVQGRLIETSEKTASGIELKSKKYIKSSTRTGAADVSSTIHGKSCQWEGKAGRDTPKPEQLREQGLERKAGGSYEFVKTPEQFFELYDKIIASISKQGVIFESQTM